VQKAKKPKIKKEKPKIQEEKIAASLIPVLIELNKKAETQNTIKEEAPEQSLTPDLIDVIIQQKLS
jgi:hypothetical protein